MSNSEADKKAAIKGAEDRGESVGLLEPLVFSEGSLSDGSSKRSDLLDKALEVATKSTALRSSLPQGVETSLATLVRAMNCYYSNLIEGHDTHPVEIERALQDEYSADAKKRNLQLEARAHIAVQQWIDESDSQLKSTSVETLLEIHRRFCELLPEELLWVENPDTKERLKVVPGQLRECDVKVGEHVAISPGALPRFLERFENAYKMLGKTDTILASGIAHHRILWMHPFLDGNGRVTRLMSYAMLRGVIDTGGIWSIARGLARNQADYKSHLASCDMPRRNDLDGRGHLSLEATTKFVEFFLDTCLDQITFMEQLIQPVHLRNRILLWAEEQVRLGALPEKSGLVLEALLYKGQLERGEVTPLLGVSDRQARRVPSALLEKGVIISKSTRAPLFLTFPAALAHRWMPGLFPEKIE